MNYELREILTELNDANKQTLEVVKELLAVIREHEHRIYALENKNG